MPGERRLRRLRPAHAPRRSPAVAALRARVGAARALRRDGSLPSVPRPAPRRPAACSPFPFRRAARCARDHPPCAAPPPRRRATAASACSISAGRGPAMRSRSCASAVATRRAPRRDVRRKRRLRQRHQRVADANALSLLAKHPRDARQHQRRDVDFRQLQRSGALNAVRRRGPTGGDEDEREEGERANGH